MKLRKIIFAIIAILAIVWISAFIFVTNKVDNSIKKFSPDEVQISYDSLYVVPSIQTPLKIVIKNLTAIANKVTFSADAYVYAGFSEMLAEMDLAVTHNDETIVVPISISTKRSANKNFYLDSFNIKNASIITNDCKIDINGGVKFYQYSLPIGSYDIVISDTYKLLNSSLLQQHPKILYKLERILGRVNNSINGTKNIKLDYTENGMKLDNIAIENL